MEPSTFDDLINCSPLLYYQSIEDDDRPSSLADCVDSDNNLIEEKYALFLEKEEDLDAANAAIMRALATSLEKSNGAENPPTTTTPAVKRPRKKRQHKSLKPFWIDDNGNIVSLKPKQTYWYLLY